MKKQEIKYLLGKTIKEIKPTNRLDHGFELIFTDGSTLEVCWNNFEGHYTLNKK